MIFDLTWSDPMIWSNEYAIIEASWASFHTSVIKQGNKREERKAKIFRDV